MLSGRDVLVTARLTAIGCNRMDCTVSSVSLMIRTKHLRRENTGRKEQSAQHRATGICIRFAALMAEIDQLGGGRVKHQTKDSHVNIFVQHHDKSQPSLHSEYCFTTAED